MFNNQTINKNGNECAILRIMYYKPRDLIFQRLTVEGKFKKIEVSRTRNSSFVDVLASTQEIVEIVGKLIEYFRRWYLSRELYKEASLKNCLLQDKNMKMKVMI